MDKQIVSMHIGSGEITVVSAHWARGGEYVLDGFYRTGAKGLREGVVTDTNEAIDSIARSLNGIRGRTGIKFREVYTGITSPSVDMMPAMGDVLLSKYGREINPGDMKKCVEMGSVIKLPLERESLHKLVSEFYVDGEKGIKNPVNLEAVKLGVKINIITIRSNILNNLIKCINMAGYLSSGFVLSGLASSYRTLTQEDKNEGAALIRISKEITEILFFNKGVMTNCKVLAKGADNIMASDNTINEDVLGELTSRIRQYPEWKQTKRIVLTGEGSMYEGMLESWESSLNSPVKIGNCLARPFENLPEDRMGYIVSLGILDHLYREKQQNRLANNLINGAFYRVTGFIDKYF